MLITLDTEHLMTTPTVIRNIPPSHHVLDSFENDHVGKDVNGDHKVTAGVEGNFGEVSSLAKSPRIKERHFSKKCSHPPPNPLKLRKLVLEKNRCTKKSGFPCG